MESTHCAVDLDVERGHDNHGDHRVQKQQCQVGVHLKETMIEVQGDTSRCAKPPIDFKTKDLLWPGLARPGQRETFVLKSTGGFAQCDVSPCTSGGFNKCQS